MCFQTLFIIDVNLIMALMNILSYRVDYSTHIERELQWPHTCSDYDSFNEFDVTISLDFIDAWKLGYSSLIACYSSTRSNT